MGKLARRKKDVTIDGADFVIAPLTYSQIEEYGERQKSFREQFKEYMSRDPNVERSVEELERDREAINASRDIALFVVCQSLNNLDEHLNLTVEDVLKEMDDELAGKLFREILSFTGIRIPKQIQPKAGEAGAGS